MWLQSATDMFQGPEETFRQARGLLDREPATDRKYMPPRMACGRFSQIFAMKAE